MKFTKLNYCQYLLSSQINYILTNLAEHLEQNSHGTDNRGARVLVDANLNAIGSSMTVILNTAEVANLPGYTGLHKVGSTVLVQQQDGTTYVEIQPISASEFLILTNHP